MIHTNLAQITNLVQKAKFTIHEQSKNFQINIHSFLTQLAESEKILNSKLNQKNNNSLHISLRLQDSNQAQTSLLSQIDHNASQSISIQSIKLFATLFNFNYDLQEQRLILPKIPLYPSKETPIIQLSIVIKYQIHIIKIEKVKRQLEEGEDEILSGDEDDPKEKEVQKKQIETDSLTLHHELDLLQVLNSINQGGTSSVLIKLKNNSSIYLEAKAFDQDGMLRKWIDYLSFYPENNQLSKSYQKLNFAIKDSKQKNDIKMNNKKFQLPKLTHPRKINSKPQRSLSGKRIQIKQRYQLSSNQPLTLKNDSFNKDNLKSYSFKEEVHQNNQKNLDDILDMLKRENTLLIKRIQQNHPIEIIINKKLFGQLADGQEYYVDQLNGVVYSTIELRCIECDQTIKVKFEQSPVILMFPNCSVSIEYEFT